MKITLATTVAATLLATLAVSADARADAFDSWTKAAVGSPASPNSASPSVIAYGNDTFVVPVELGKIARSPDGATWTVHSVPTTGAMTAIGFGNGMFVASFRSTTNGTQRSGIILVSNDGIRWKKTASVTETPECLTYANGTWMGCVTGGVLASTDAHTWTKTPFGGPASTASMGFTSIAWGNGTWVGVGFTSSSWSSPDGQHWTQHPPPTADMPSSVAYGKGKFVAVGRTCILTSPDGTTWTPRAIPEATAWYRAVVWADEKWVTVGRTTAWPTGSSVATSDDGGVTWAAHKGPEVELQGLARIQSRFVAITNAGTPISFYAWWTGQAPVSSLAVSKPLAPATGITPTSPLR